jgi:hypothetical protein
MLSLGWPLAPDRHTDVPMVAPAPAVAVAVITVSLPPDQVLAESLGAETSALELTALPLAEPAQPDRKPARTLHARHVVRRPDGPIAVPPQSLPEQPETVWVRVAQWLTRHEAPRAWTQDGGQGMGS